MTELKQAISQGCTINRPTKYVNVNELKAGSGGTFVTTDPENWGDIDYIAGLLDANADIDYKKHDRLLRMWGLAQLFAWHEKKA